MSSSFGNQMKTTVFGESHGRAIGVVLEGLPAGEEVDMAELQAFMDRRAPGSGPLTTARREGDQPTFLSGIAQGRTTGFPLAAIIENTDVKSEDYSGLRDIPRPGHADFTAALRYGGWADMRGGGHFSGRLTAPLCIGGAIAIQILKRRGILIGAHLHSVHGIADKAYDGINLSASELLLAGGRSFPVNDEAAGEAMKEEIRRAAAEGDSVGGVIECAVLGMASGLGDPMFDGLENNLAKALFGIPAVKGVEFGAGFFAAEMKGSEHNDAFSVTPEGNVVTETNRHGGALGGITTGMPVILRTAIKPTPSISRKQSSVSLSSLTPEELEIRGRHDPCIALRAVPCVEAVTALVVLDMVLKQK